MDGLTRFFEVLSMVTQAWAKANGLGDGDGWYFLIEDAQFRLV